MANWSTFASAAPEMAATGRALFEQFGIAYLASVRKDGGPRVHPICPVLIEDYLFVGIIATSPKCDDLLRDQRYVLHALPGPNDTEFFIRGIAEQVTDPALLALIEASGNAEVAASDEHILFMLDIDLAYAASYEVEELDGQTRLRPIRQRWRCTDSLMVGALP